jgi:hypothetical protein
VKTMLKIKDNVDLKELEKFGFYYDDGDWIKDYIPYKNNSYSFMAIGIDNRKIDLWYIKIDEHLENAISDLFDLIQAGLVEKVSD